MEFSIGSQFSREFSWEDSSITYDLAKYLNDFFQYKSYGDIDLISISAICVSEGFKSFFKLRRPKYTEREKVLEFEFELDFGRFFNLDYENKKIHLIEEFYQTIEGVLTQHRTRIKIEDDLLLSDLIILLKQYK